MIVDPNISALDGLRELSARATPGPWSLDLRLSPLTVQGADHPRYASIVSDERGARVDSDTGKASAALIVASVNLVRDLLSDEGIERMARAYVDTVYGNYELNWEGSSARNTAIPAMRAAISALLSEGGAG